MELHFKVAILCVGWFFWFRFISCGNPDGVWNCSCASEGTSQSPGNIHPASCFTACNCTSGTSTGATKHLSHKGVVVILLLCVAFTTIAFLTSIACYFYRKDQFSLPSPSFSSEKNTSWNSMTNLINHRSTSFPQCQAKNNTGFDGLTGFIRRLFWVFGSERGTFLGAIVQFSYVELEQATNKFSSANLIGIGGSSNVYRGHLKDGRVVAVKRLRSLGWPEADSEFLSEIELLSRLNHCHVVPLLGYCSESQGKQSERLLVFEYMSNGNLRDCLDAAHEKDPLDWETRVQIAIGAARGLEYLHEAAAPRILHRDIKSTNILLDDKYRAKITDLGMAKRLMADDLTSCSSSPARMLGTFGYFAPEYAIVGKASLKSDVFSFGVVILELITGRQAIHKSSNKGDESLVIWATARLRDHKLVVSELPDPLLKGKFPEEEIQIMAHLARECLQWDPELRPTMSEVVQILSTITPHKSKRRNIPTSFFMSTSSSGIKVITGIERSQGPVERLEPSRAASERWHARCSLPITIDRNLCEDHQKNTEMVLAAEYMERLILLTSNVQNRRSSDEETVDLTEPRFESFMQANVQSL
ncbi:receptor-like serine/threonine-protein kinase NCRK isoform X2 [Elaeis guineensis]|uniref:non-specific serine/threonine protein kinase n=1 Tax=Elaeis guineensis var. tenera TaxID=51953 RepID=A0A6J0PQ59_ELAGV|nr:receptor-like serine/threonine-protein kinase NCRK isoform X2 [Elaeis guineensis]XP_029123606.1 receptor-like serine/threonine-protein kinase NCRK isoform X2 [Elaeis guineensis]